MNNFEQNYKNDKVKELFIILSYFIKQIYSP